MSTFDYLQQAESITSTAEPLIICAITISLMILIFRYFKLAIRDVDENCELDYDTSHRPPVVRNSNKFSDYLVPYTSKKNPFVEPQQKFGSGVPHSFC